MKLNIQMFAEEQGRIKAGMLATFLKAGMDGDYVRIGKDLEEFTISHNREVTKAENIWNEQSISIGGIQAESTVAPYYAYPGEPLFEWLWDMIKDNKQLTQVETKLAEVELWEGTIKEAREQTVHVETTLHGVANTTGFRIEYNLHYVGNVVKGTWTPGVSEIPGQQTGTFTPKEAEEI